MLFSKLSMVISWYSGLRHREAWYVEFPWAYKLQLQTVSA